MDVIPFLISEKVSFFMIQTLQHIIQKYWGGSSHSTPLVPTPLQIGNFFEEREQKYLMRKV